MACRLLLLPQAIRILYQKLEKALSTLPRNRPLLPGVDLSIDPWASHAVRQPGASRGFRPRNSTALFGSSIQNFMNHQGEPWVVTAASFRILVRPGWMRPPSAGR